MTADDGRSPKEMRMPSRAKKELIEVYLVKSDGGRQPFSFELDAFEYFSPDAPLPQVGDLILLPRRVTGDTEEQTFAWGGSVAPFRVIERQHVYFRSPDEPFDRVKPTPARYVRTVICVRRLSEKEFEAGYDGSAG